MVENLTLSIKDEINFANDVKNNTNDFDFISSLHNLLTNNFKQCKTFETNYKPGVAKQWLASRMRLFRPLLAAL